MLSALASSAATKASISMSMNTLSGSADSNREISSCKLYNVFFRGAIGAFISSVNLLRVLFDVIGTSCSEEASVLLVCTEFCSVRNVCRSRYPASDTDCFEQFLLFVVFCVSKLNTAGTSMFSEAV